MKRKLLTLLCMLPLLALAQTTENFEGTWTVPATNSGAGGPTGWAIVNASGTGESWEQASDGSYMGAHHATISGETVTPATDMARDWLISPSILVPTDGVLRFYSKLSQPGNQGSVYRVRVKPVSTGTITEQVGTGNYTQVAQWSEIEINPTQTEWTEKVVSLQAYAGQQVYIAFVLENNGGDGWSIDNVNVTQSCGEVSNITATNISLDSATIGWTSPAGVTSFMVEIVPITAAPTGAGVTVTTNPYTVTGLAGGLYKAYVWCICPDGTVGAPAGPCIFTVPVCLPEEQCTYTFNLTDEWNDGWNGNTMNVVQNGSIVAVLSLPVGSADSVDVPMCDSVPFELHWNNGGTFPQEVGVSIVNAYGQTIYTKEAGTGTPGTLLYEGLAQCTADACYPPYNQWATVVGTTATIGWTTESNTEWQYFVVEGPVLIMPENNTPPTGTTTDNPFVLNDLLPNTQYTVYVRSVCEGMFGDIYSNWVSVYFAIGSGNYLTGTVSVDVNGDGICNDTDLAVPGAQLTVTIAEEAPIVLYANAQGEYVLDNIPLGQDIPITFLPVAPDGFEAQEPVTQTFTFPSETAPEVDFCFDTPESPLSDIEVTLIPLNGSQAGFYAQYSLVVHNNSIIAVNDVVVTVAYDGQHVTLYSVNDPYTEPDTNTFVVSVGSIPALGTNVTDVWMHILPPPTNMGGEQITYVATAAMAGTDENPANNTYQLTQTIGNSYDPNDIIVHEGSWVNIEDAADYLHYTIRFQNTGNAPAVNIRIENELDENLDWDTFEPIIASHNYTAARRNGNELEFLFENIFLADSTSNEPASHGYITYRVKPKADIAVNDEVHSTAAIYFDFNEPVITNTAITVFGVLSLPDNRLQNVRLYPNPVNNELHISVLDGSLQSLRVFDLNGRLCLSSGGQNVVNTHALTAGLYMVKVETDSGTSSFKLIKQ